MGDEYNIPTLAVLKTDQEIDDYQFPDNCCVKPTHGSGEIIIRRNNSAVDRGLLKLWLKQNYYDKSREINYKTLEPKIIIEPILWNNDNISDYKFFCYKGKVGLIQVDLNRRTNHTRLLFDRNLNPQSFRLHVPKEDGPFSLPENITKMIDIAEPLSAKFDFIRIDLYSDGDSCKLGEITNYHLGGNETFFPPSAEVAASKLIFG